MSVPRPVAMPRFTSDDLYDPEDDEDEDWGDEYDTHVSAPPPPKRGAPPASAGSAGRGRGAAPGRGGAQGGGKPTAQPGRGSKAVPGRGGGGAAQPSSTTARVAPSSDKTIGSSTELKAARVASAASKTAASELSQLALLRISAASDTAATSSSRGHGVGQDAASPGVPAFASYVPEPWEVVPGITGDGVQPSPPPLHVVALGHVDAGKSSAMGRLLHACGAMTAAQARAAEKAAAGAGHGSESWAWSMDTRPEERERGVTVDVALARVQAPQECGGPPLVILDAPGHRDFVPAALEAASRADVALLFVDASVGAFEAGIGGAGTSAASSHSYSSNSHAAPHGGQTLEHAVLARACGCVHLVVVINKMDAVGWDKSRFDTVRAVLGPHLKSAGWKDASITWVPCAGRDGVNLATRVATELPGHPLAAWWPADQPCVLSAALAAPRSPPPPPGPLRLPVWEILASGETPGGTGRLLGPLACGGRIESGALRVGQTVVLSPSGATTTVKALHSGGHSLTVAHAGDAVEVGLAPLTAPPAVSGSGGGAAPALLPGVVLCTMSHPAPAAMRLTLRVRILGIRVPLLRGSTVTVHLGAAREPASVSDLQMELDAHTGEMKRARPRCLARGTVGVIDVTLARPIAAERYEDCPHLGRVALREGGATLALGVVQQVWTTAGLDT